MTTILNRLCLLSCLVLLTGCQDKEIRSYEIPKQAPKGWPTQPHARQIMGSQKGAPMGNPAAGTGTASTPEDPTMPDQATPMMGATSSGGTMQALPGMAEQSAQFDTPTWTAPEHWEAQPLGNMRKGSWMINRDGESAELSVLVFPGDVGGDLANVNRWAGQIGATPLTPETLAAMQQAGTVSVDNHDGFLVTLDGPTGKSIAGVILPYHGATWFFKMQGDTALVNDEAAALGQFMSTVRFPAH